MSINFQPGSLIYWNQSQSGWIIDVLDVERLYVRNIKTSRREIVNVADVIADPNIKLAAPDLTKIPDDQFQKLDEKYKVLKPLLDLARNHIPISEIENAAEKLDCSISSIYRDLAKLRLDNRLTALIRKRRKDIRASRLPKEVEKAIQEILPYYTDIQKRSFTVVYQELKNRCEKMGIRLPHYNTLRSRINELSAYKIDAGRQGIKFANLKHSKNRGKFPNAEFPWAVIQIDHTPVDLIFVDEDTRKPINRVFLTVALDVYTRMIVGFYLSLDPVGLYSTAMCIVQAMLPKERYLRELGVKGNWPVYGTPVVIHTDNAKEFNAKPLVKACKAYGFDLAKRPKGRPNYGGRIESVIKTLMQQTHSLPGTTNSNVAKNNKYDSAGNACFTMKEFEQWLAQYIVNEYHQKVHEGINYPPIKLWEEAILGNSERPGIGLPPKIADEHKLFMDFLPHFERTIQQYGVKYKYRTYWHDIFNTMINKRDPSNPKNKKEYLFRYDMKDMSSIWFYDEVRQEYIQIPSSNLTAPPISLWEQEAATKDAKKHGKSLVNEDTILESYRHRKEIEETAKNNTASARRASQRRKDDEKARKNPAFIPSTRKPKPVQNNTDDIVITAADDIDE